MRCEIERIQATILALMYGGHSEHTALKPSGATGKSIRPTQNKTGEEFAFFSGR